MSYNRAVKHLYYQLCPVWLCSDGVGNNAALFLSLPLFINLLLQSNSMQYRIYSCLLDWEKNLSMEGWLFKHNFDLLKVFRFQQAAYFCKKLKEKPFLILWCLVVTVIYSHLLDGRFLI